MNKMPSRVLITGATGNIGRLLVAELQSKATVRAFVRNAEFAGLGRDIEIDVGNLSDAQHLISFGGIDGCCLCGATSQSDRYISD